MTRCPDSFYCITIACRTIRGHRIGTSCWKRAAFCAPGHSNSLPRDWAAAHARTVATFPQCLALADGNELAAEKLGDHRRDYLEYEGELSGNRGRVIRVAEGVFVEQWETLMGWCLLLDGATISGQIELDREGDNRERLRLTPM